MISKPFGLTLLVVDDEPDLVRSLKRILSSQGFQVGGADSGEEAVTWSQNHRPDGILMDIRMPGINGVEAYRQIRALRPDAFVIFGSGEGGRAGRPSGRAFQADRSCGGLSSARTCSLRWP